ncbi:MAG: T9SS type A sorting domain-containing protein [Sphingobacteriales bacterium]|nr:MAG: T9SS type A sorting domain-containing protein [Sphingobacteriales bacterium]
MNRVTIKGILLKTNVAKRFIQILVLLFLPCILSAQTVSMNQPFTDTLICLGSNTIKVPYTVSGSFTSGNVFTAQLSNASGSFSSPVNIGIDTSVISDTIVCAIPANTATGNGYRVRIVSSNPVTTPVNNGRDIHIIPSPEFMVDSVIEVCTHRRAELNLMDADTVNTYLWSGPSGYTSTLRTPVIDSATRAAEGYYSITVSKGGCSTTKSVLLYLKPNASLPPTVTSNSPLCTGDTLMISAGGFGGTIYTILIGRNYMDTCICYTRLFVPTFADTGQYFAMYLSNEGCVSDTGHHRVVMNNVFVPTAIIWPMPGNDVNLYTPVTFYSRVYNHYKPRYQWFVNGKPRAGATDTMFTMSNFSSGDKVHVMVYSDTTCTQIVSSDTVILNIKLGVDDVTHANKIALFPNPTNGKCSIRLADNFSGAAAVEVFNMHGRCVYRKNVVTKDGVLEDVDITSVPSGMYHLKLTMDASSFGSSFVKE